MTLLAHDDILNGILSICERLPLWLAIPVGLLLFGAFCIALVVGKEWFDRWTGETPKG